MGSYLGIQSYLLYLIADGHSVISVSGVDWSPCTTANSATVTNTSDMYKYTTPVFIGEDCNIRSLHTDAISALNRASSLSCKREIETVACAIQSGEFYANSLPNTCDLGEDPAREFEHRESNDSTRPARIFYLLQLHERAVQQILRLFRAIYHPAHFYYLHVDAHFDYLYHSLLPLEKMYKNVKLASSRYRTMWGGASLLDMVMGVMREALWNIDWEWDYFVNLSGADFPVRSNEEITRVLGEHLGENFVKPHNGDSEVFITKQGINYTFIQCDDHMWKLGPRQLPQGITIDGGSDWITLHRDFIEFVLTTDDILLRQLKLFFKYTLLPVESFFHTVLRNSRFCHTYVKHNLRIVNWIRKLGCKCQYKHIVDWCGCSPNDLRQGDIRKLIDQPEYILFARKFESIVDNVILNLLESYLTTGDPQRTNYYTESVYDREYSQVGPVVMLVWSSLLRLHKESAFNCETTDDVIIEVFIANKNDMRSNLIVETGKVQILYSYNQPVIEFNRTNKPERFRDARVGSEWDQKERIFRNYHGILTSQDSPQLSLSWNHGAQVNITIKWISPSNKLESSFQMSIDSTWTVTYHKPILAKPIEAGMWRVEIHSEISHFISIQFIVFSDEMEEEEMGMALSKMWEVKNVCNIADVNSNCSRFKKCDRVIWSPKSQDIFNELV